MNSETILENWSAFTFIHSVDHYSDEFDHSHAGDETHFQESKSPLPPPPACEEAVPTRPVLLNGVACIISIKYMAGSYHFVRSQFNLAKGVLGPPFQPITRGGKKGPAEPSGLIA